MKIRSLLGLGAFFLVALAFAIGAVVGLATDRAERIAAQGAVAERIVSQVFELNLLAQEYVTHYDERPRVQWERQYAALEETLASPLLRLEPSSAHLGAIEEDMAALKASFDRLVERADIAKRNIAAEGHLSGDLLVNARRAVSDVDDLARTTFEARAANRARTDQGVRAALWVQAALALAFALLVHRRAVVPLERLQKGVQVIGKGDLGHRVGSTTEDEVGELSRAFDVMAAALKASYAGLERKVRDRTAELATMSRRNEMLLESIGDGVVAIDEDWNIILWNPAAEKIAGWTRRQAIGKPFRTVMRLIRESDRTENILFISEVMLTGQSRMMENHTLLIRKDGTEVPVADSAAPIIDKDKKVTGAVIVFRDATAERDAMLVRSSFAYASHQLRTPVNKALWSLETMRDDSPTPEFAARIATAANDVKSVHKLVTALVEVSEADQGMLIPKFQEVQAASVLAEAVAAVAEKASLKKMTVDTAIDPKVGAVVTDRRMLQRTLVEVLDNAIEYAAAGSGVTLAAVVAGKELRISVKNVGLGIPFAQQGIVFTKFFRGSNVPSESVGAGLGLYLAKQYVSMLKGKIWFISQEGEGAEFFLSVPLL